MTGQQGCRSDGGYVGRCTGCRFWYWNSWGAGTYCGACLHGYTEALKDNWEGAEVRVEALQDVRDRLRGALEKIRYEAGWDTEMVQHIASEALREEGAA